VGYLGDSVSVTTSRQRFEGYQHALDQAGIAPDPAMVAHGLRTVGAAIAATAAMMASPYAPTALFASQNLVTIGAVTALHQLGLEDRVALVGFDDFLLADVLEPGVTVMAQDTARLGSVAAQLLFTRRAGDTSPPAVHTVPVRLVPRGSGEIKPQLG